jgi:hypothetical protein
MSFPTSNTNLFGPDVPVNIPVPAVGSTNYFFNQNDNNRIWYKNSDAQFFAYSAGGCDPCLCEEAANTMCAWNKALLEKTITPEQYTALVSLGITFTCTNDTDTWTMTIGVTTP